MKTDSLYKSGDSFAIMNAFYDQCLEDYGDLVTSMYVNTCFGKTHLLVAGEKHAPPVLLIQGMAGSSVLWHHQLKDFSKHFRIYALDVIGQPGRSDPGIPSLLNNDLSRWLKDFMDQLQLKKASMIGISSGGWAIIQFGILYPDRLDKDVLLSPLRLSRARLNGSKWVKTGMKKDQEGDKLEDRLSVRDFNPGSDGRKYDVKLAKAMALATRHYKLGAAMGIDVQAAKIKKLAQGIRVIWFFMTPVSGKVLKQFKNKALVLIGEHEALYKPHKAVKRLAKQPHIRAEIISGAGHAVVFDKAEEVNQRIISFLQND